MNAYIAGLIASQPRGYNADNLAEAAAVLENRVRTAPNSKTYPAQLEAIRREQAKRRHPSFKTAAGVTSYIHY